MNLIIEETDYRLKSMPGVDKILGAALIANIGNINPFLKKSKVNSAGVTPLEYHSNLYRS